MESSLPLPAGAQGLLGGGLARGCQRQISVLGVRILKTNLSVGAEISEVSGIILEGLGSELPGSNRMLWCGLVQVLGLVSKDIASENLYL